MNSEREERAATPADPLEGIDRRIAGLTAWLSENAPFCDIDQNHLDGSSVEQAYWHYGYLIALRDVRALIARLAKGS
jgi:hypothetical protein